MAFKVHTIDSHRYTFDGTRGIISVLHLFGPDNQHRLLISFVDDTEPVPPPIIAPNLEFAACFFRAGAFPGLLDMLRNEDRVSVTLADEGPGSVFVGTATGRADIGGEAAEKGTGSMPA